MKKILFTIISICLSFIFFLIVGEICFRIFRNDAPPLAAITQKNKHYLLTPGQVIVNKSSVPGEFDYVTTINSHGYRGKEFSKIKDPARQRIMAVGDSFTFGIVADEFTIPYLMQEALNKENLKVEVINAGIGHASPLDQYLNFKNFHLDYQPDVVVYLFDLTDLWDDWHKERQAVYGSDGEIQRIDPMYVNGKKDWWITATYYSAFCRYFNNKIVRTFKKIQLLGFKEYAKAVIEGKKAKALIANAEKIDAKDKIEYDGLAMMRGRDKKDLILNHWPRTAGYLKKIHQLLKERNIPMVLVVYPHGIYVGKTQWSKGRLSWGFEANKRYDDYFPFELVEVFAKEEGIGFINSLPAFPLTDDQKYFYDWDGHLNEKGSAIVARAIAESEVLKKVLVNK